MFSTLPAGIWMALVGTPLLIAIGQVLFKLTSASAPDFGLRGLVQLALNPLLIAALVLYGAGTLIWIHVLKSVPLTIAYSFMGLTFCFVPLLAVLFLGETVTVRYALGAALIVAGMLVING